MALVGRDKTTVHHDRGLEYLEEGRQGSVTLTDPTRYERITAVVVNADGRIDGRARDGRDWHYLNDNAALKIKLKSLAPCRSPTGWVLLGRGGRGCVL